MSKVIVTKSKLVNIANAIRERNNNQMEYNLDNMPIAISNIQNIYSFKDEGKVVINGELIEQVEKENKITANGTYDTTIYNTINIEVPNTTKIDGVYIGNFPPDSSFGENGDLYIQQPDINLPKEVRTVQYIESINQYIDTRLYGNNKIKFLFKIVLLDNDSEGYLLFCDNNNFELSCNNRILSVKINEILEDFELTGDELLEYIDGNFYINKIFQKKIYPQNFITSNTISLFSNSTINVRVSRVILANDFTILKDYIPIIDENGIACLYEVINDEILYGDNKEGYFNAGQEKEISPIRYEYKKINNTWVLDRWIF